MGGGPVIIFLGLLATVVQPFELSRTQKKVSNMKQSAKEKAKSEGKAKGLKVTLGLSR